jgi:phosphatidylglycerophosphate synthase
MAASLRRSIWITCASFLVGQLVTVAAIAVGYEIPWSRVAWFVFCTPLLHLLMALGLNAVADLFVLAENHLALDRVNVANILSLSRISSAPTLLLLVTLAREYKLLVIVVVLAVLVFLTDLLDGQVSRRTGQVTEIGRYLDSTSDYVLIGILVCAMLYYQLLATWVFVLIIVRLGIQAVGQAVLFFVRRKKLVFSTSFLGKASVFALMTLLAASLLRIIPGFPDWAETGYRVLTYLVSAVVGVSLVEKVVIIVKSIRSPESEF